MDNREHIIDVAGDLVKDKPTPEVMLMSLILRVLLDIRDQNGEMLKEQSDGYSNEP